GERYQAGLSYLELGRLAAGSGARSRATRYLSDAAGLFESLGAAPELAETRSTIDRIPSAGTGGYVGVRMDGDDAIVRRLVEASAMPALLAREGATAVLEACEGQTAVVYVQRPGSPGSNVQLIAWSGGTEAEAREI